MSASQKIAPRVQSLFKRIISTPGRIFKSWCQRNEPSDSFPSSPKGQQMKVEITSSTQTWSQVNVTYRDGQEFYSEVRVDGQPAPANASEPSGNWSHGEFATMLTSIFAPSSKAQFHYSKQTKLHSIPALVFDFEVAARNNRLYFLESRDKTWFPEYGGKIWVDVRTSSLLRLKLETAYMQDYPITRTKNESITRISFWETVPAWSCPPIPTR